MIEKFFFLEITAEIQPIIVVFCGFCGFFFDWAQTQTNTHNMNFKKKHSKERL